MKRYRPEARCAPGSRPAGRLGGRVVPLPGTRTSRLCLSVRCPRLLHHWPPGQARPQGVETCGSATRGRDPGGLTPAGRRQAPLRLRCRAILSPAPRPWARRRSAAVSCHAKLYASGLSGGPHASPSGPVALTRSGQGALSPHAAADGPNPHVSDTLAPSRRAGASAPTFGTAQRAWTVLRR